MRNSLGASVGRPCSSAGVLLPPPPHPGQAPGTWGSLSPAMAPLFGGPLDAGWTQGLRGAAVRGREPTAEGRPAQEHPQDQQGNHRPRPPGLLRPPGTAESREPSKAAPDHLPRGLEAPLAAASASSAARTQEARWGARSPYGHMTPAEPIRTPLPSPPR